MKNIQQKEIECEEIENVFFIDIHIITHQSINNKEYFFIEQSVA